MTADISIKQGEDGPLLAMSLRGRKLEIYSVDCLDYVAIHMYTGDELQSAFPRAGRILAEVTK